MREFIMAASNQTLPEGTDTIIEGAGAGENDADFTSFDTAATDEAGSTGIAVGDVTLAGSGAGNAARDESATGEGVRDQLFGRYETLRGQAGDKARDFVQAGKDRATSALDDVVRMIEDAATEVDGKIGSQYGDYARRAAQGIGEFSDTFKNKEIDELFGDARQLIQKSPSVAIGIAAALGFAVARLARAGVGDAADTHDNDASKA